MHRFYLPPPECQGTSLSLSERDAHHAANVLRLRTGDIITVLDGMGRELSCRVEAVSRRNVTVSVQERKFTPAMPYSVTLLQGVPKGRIIEDIIQKATELGANTIVPLLTERVTTQLDPEAAAEKQQKWQHVAIEAIKQCGQPWLPTIDKPISPEEFVRRNHSFDLPLVASLQEDSRHASRYFTQFVQRETRAPKSVCVWVGPEGDFSPEEMDLIKSTGARPITLGKLVLRCETAAIYCLSMINYELQARYE